VDAVIVKKTLVETPSGRIEIIHNGVFTVLQYNTSCEDALPYCKGMCCGLRAGYNVLLKPGEEKEFESIPHPMYLGRYMLASDPKDMHCVYQDKMNGFCTIHSNKPQGCRDWHCSPGGQGEDVVKRDLGWFLSPMQGNLQDKEIKDAELA
jgi:hypothetical protein